MRRTILCCAAVSALAFPFLPAAAAQNSESVTPRVENARFEQRELSGPLAAEIKNWSSQAAPPHWLGYAVPEIPSDRTACCGDYHGSWGDGCGRCRLENGHDESNITSKEPATIRLEAPRYLFVLLRAENKQLSKIRIASEDCTLDAGGLPFLWLTGVKPTDSVDLLSTFVLAQDLDSRDAEHTAHGALTAIPLHADPAADRALDSFVQPSQAASLRRQAAFWLGEARGAAGLRALQQMAKSDPSPDVRAHVAFALSVSHEPAAVEEIIRMAHSDDSAHVRGQALFWLAHKAGQKALGVITGAIAADPDTEVKKKAVFALSQLPKDEGVPKLIEVAQSNPNREVRKQAMFWLGQSNDPRALAFFEKILAR